MSLKSLFIFFILFALITVDALAAGGAGHGLDAETKKKIIFQCINVTILFAGLFFVLRNPTKQMFKDKKDAYLVLANKAQAAKDAALVEKKEIEMKLAKLESTSEDSIQRAKAEAIELKKQLISEAQSIAVRIKTEAEQTARIEIEKAKLQLRSHLINESVKLAQSQIVSKVSQEDHQRLNGAFIDNISGARS